MKKLVLCSLTIFALFLSSCGNALLLKSKTYTVKYEVTGTLGTLVNITIRNSSEELDKFLNVSLPWEVTFDVSLTSDDYFSAYLCAENLGTGLVTATIYKNGEVLCKSTSPTEAIASESFYY
jgi:hypothetical protein